jgi:hypothetical protein
MFDGIKILDVSVDIDALLTNDRLTFAALVDGQTGAILDPTRRAFERGLTFRLVPRKTGNGYRAEVKGSLHKFHNKGQHNADQFTVNSLLLTLDELVCSYGFNLFTSTINNIEFGVNVELPFPVSQVLKNLICYKNEPFYLDTHSDTPYYVCLLQRYAVKVYDKGKQRGLNANLLRFEIRVRKMAYFNGTGIKLSTLADLANVANYEPLGALLTTTFNEILFDDPTIRTANLTPEQKTIYRNGRNPRYWQIPDDLPPQQANAHRQRLSRNRRRYRSLFEQYGGNWQKVVSALIGQTWQQLTAVDTHLLGRINEYKTKWKEQIKPPVSLQPTNIDCHELTNITFVAPENVSDSPCHKLTGPTQTDLSQINPLYSGLACDTNHPAINAQEPGDVPPKTDLIVCLVTRIVIDCPRPRQRFISVTQLRTLYSTDRLTFDDLAERYLTNKQAGATLEKQCYYMAHNIRNAYTNQFNNPLRRLKKYQRSTAGQLPLFTIDQSIKPTAQIQAGINYRKGTRHEIGL